MRLTSVFQISSLVFLSILAGTADAAKSKDERSPPAGEPNAVFEAPMAKVREQAVNALTVLGCEFKKQLPDYLEGKRSRKIGVMVGSGGETLRVWLSEVEGKTEVRVSTDKTFVGGAGQKNWDKEIIEELKKGMAAPGA
jgi:hypothetical protein